MLLYIFKQFSELLFGYNLVALKSFFNTREYKTLF